MRVEGAATSAHAFNRFRDIAASPPVSSDPELRLIKDGQQQRPPALEGTFEQQLAKVLPAQPGGRIWALASAIGGQISLTTSKQIVGSNLDPFVRRTIETVDENLDAIVLRGLDRVVARRDPQAERIFMRISPPVLAGLPPQERDEAAVEQLVNTLRPLAQRSDWHRIVLVTPHFRRGEQAGLASKLHGIGIYFQELNNASEFDVIEPDGRPGAVKQSRFVALHYYAVVTILDAKTLQVLVREPWHFDQKIHDTRSPALRMERSISVDQLAERMAVFTEQASDRALVRSLNLVIEVKDMQVVPPNQS